MGSRFNISALKEEYAKNGWKLLAEKYVNLKTEMEALCPNGHTTFLTYEFWRQHHECPSCASKNLTEGSNTKVVPIKKGMKRLVALDQSTYTTGWAVFDDNQLVKYGVFNITGENATERIEKFRQWLLSFLITWQPQAVIIEDIQLQNKDSNQFSEVVGVTTYKTLAHLQGVILNVLYEKNIPCDVAHTAKWREYNSIKGRSRSDKKKSAQLCVDKIYARKVTQDEADAICIGRYGLSLHKELDFIQWF